MDAEKENLLMLQYRSLLSKISSCNSEGISRVKKLNYNVFDVLGVSHKEVIMCRFLADLLKPDGEH